MSAIHGTSGFVSTDPFDDSARSQVERRRLRRSRNTIAAYRDRISRVDLSCLSHNWSPLPRVWYDEGHSVSVSGPVEGSDDHARFRTGFSVSPDFDCALHVWAAASG